MDIVQRPQPGPGRIAQLRLWNRIKREVKTRIDAHCRGLVNPLWAIKHTDKADVILVARGPAGGVQGIALLRFIMTKPVNGRRQRSLYVDLICSKDGRGSELMDTANQIALRSGITLVALTAAGSDEQPVNEPLINLYRQKYQFKRSLNACIQPRPKRLPKTTPDGTPMSRCLTQRPIVRRRPIRGYSLVGGTLKKKKKPAPRRSRRLRQRR